MVYVKHATSSALLTSCYPVCQARSHDVEAQLAATTAELQELRSRQQQLEARNSLLEKISYLSNKKSNHAALDEVLHALHQSCLCHWCRYLALIVSFHHCMTNVFCHLLVLVPMSCFTFFQADSSSNVLLKDTRRPS